MSRPKIILPAPPIDTPSPFMNTRKKTAPAPNISALARDHRVSRETIRKLRTNGIDLADGKAVADGLAASKAITSQDGKDQTLTSIKRRKLELECERIEAAIRRESVGYIRMERAHEIISAFSAVIKSLLRSIEGNLPAVLEGAKPEQIAKALKDAHHGMFETLSSMELCENHPEMKRCMAEMKRLDCKNLCHECRQPKDDDHED
jgi:hypothetical protein